MDLHKKKERLGVNEKTKCFYENECIFEKRYKKKLLAIRNSYTYT